MFKANRFSDEIDQVLIHNGIINLTGEVDNGMLRYLNHLLYYVMAAPKSKKPLKVLFCSTGGSVISGLGVYDLLAGVAKKRPVHIIAQGCCMSMALIVLQAGTKRLSYPNTTFMLHELSTLIGGTLTKQQNEVAEAERLQKLLDGIISKRTGQPVEKLRKKMKGPDWYITAQDALEWKLIDEIVDL